jgi:hypothetical protein
MSLLTCIDGTKGCLGMAANASIESRPPLRIEENRRGFDGMLLPA